MASQYDKIKTPKDLLVQVSMHGFSTKIDDICRAQDIFGRAPIEDLVALANDNGRLNDQDEPDPEGTWSSGRRGYQQAFYQVLFHIWNWEDATRFYNQHTNPDFKRMKLSVAELETELTEARTEAEEHKEDCQIWEERYGTERAAHAETRKEADFYRAGYEAAHQEIIALKAKLYDMMMAQEGK